MSTDSGCAPGICQGKPAADADNCAEVNGCGQRDQYTESRAIVAKAQADIRAEYREHAGRMLQVTTPLRAVTNLLMELGEHAAVLDYAETRLTEMRAQLEALAGDVSDGVFHAQPFDHEKLADRIREVARG